MAVVHERLVEAEVEVIVRSFAVAVREHAEAGLAAIPPRREAAWSSYPLARSVARSSASSGAPGLDHLRLAQAHAAAIPRRAAPSPHEGSRAADAGDRRRGCSVPDKML
jgi:hypothetical protein